MSNDSTWAAPTGNPISDLEWVVGRMRIAAANRIPGHPHTQILRYLPVNPELERIVTPYVDGPFNLPQHSLRLRYVPHEESRPDWSRVECKSWEEVGEVMGWHPGAVANAKALYGEPVTVHVCVPGGDPTPTEQGSTPPLSSPKVGT